MKAARITFIFAAIAVFLGFSVIGALGALSIVKIGDWQTAAAIIGPCLAIVSAALGAKHLFHDTEAITDLKAQHAEQIRSMTHAHEDSEQELGRALIQKELQHEQALANIKGENASLKDKLIETEKARKELHRKYTDLMPKPRPIGSMIAPGSARTYAAPPQETTKREQAVGEQPPSRSESDS